MLHKKIITLILTTGIILAAGLLLWPSGKAEASEFTKQKLLQKFQTFKTQYKQAKEEGYNVTETKVFARQAKQAYNNGDYKKAGEFLDRAFASLETFIQSEDPSVQVSVEYKEKCKQINVWLDKKIVEWKPLEYKPMDFAAYHVFASDNVFIKSNEEIDLKVLDVLGQTNCDIIVLYIRPKSYFSQKERYDTLINKIRTDGKKLFIGARFDEVKMDFREYDKDLTDYTKNIIAAIKPDYYGIVIEPRTMERRNSFKASDEEWADLVKKISELSKQLSPGTKTAVAGHKEELEFLQLASHINSVDIIGFDIYNNGGIYSEYSGYLGKGDVIGNTIDYTNSKGKEAWILETWAADISAGRKIKMASTQEYMKSIDAKWVQVITYYALRHNMKVITPFFTGKFVAYTDEPTEFKSALDKKQRTLAFYAYKSVIEEIRNNSK